MKPSLFLLKWIGGRRSLARYHARSSSVVCLVSLGFLIFVIFHLPVSCIVGLGKIQSQDDGQIIPTTNGHVICDFFIIFRENNMKL